MPYFIPFQEKDFKTGLFKGGTNISEIVVSTDHLEPYQDLYVDALANLKNVTWKENRDRSQAMSYTANVRKAIKTKRQDQQVKRLHDRGPKMVI